MRFLHLTPFVSFRIQISLVMFQCLSLTFRKKFVFIIIGKTNLFCESCKSVTIGDRRDLTRDKVHR